MKIVNHIRLNELINNCCQNDPSAQAKIYQLFAAKLFALCLKYSQNKEDAEDVLQDSFLMIFKKIKQYDHKGSFEGWIKRITINVALQKHRQMSQLRVLRQGELENEIVYVENDQEIGIDVLLGFIQQLPNQYRLVFNLYVLDRFSHKKIGEMLQISEGTSKSNLSRARLILKEKITEYQIKNQKTSHVR